MGKETPRLSSRYDQELPFDIDVSGAPALRFHWEPEMPTVRSLRIEGTCVFREGHLVIDRLSQVGPSRYLVGEDGQRRRREGDELAPGGIDSAAWKDVHIGQTLGRLRAFQADLARFIGQLLPRVADPQRASYLARQLESAQRQAAPPVRGRKPSITGTFLAGLSEQYLVEIAHRPHGAIKRIANDRGYSPNTVKGWLARAKRDQWLIGGGPRGVAYAHPGPTLIAYLQKEA